MMQKQSSYPIDTIRHSTAHLLAAAVLELYPKTKLGVGPVIEHGFFYDLDALDKDGNQVKLTSEDLKRIDKRMRELAKRSIDFRREEMSLEQAIAFFKEHGQDFKVELLMDLKTRGTTKIRVEELQDINVEKPNVASLYWTGNFIDLCRGPHVGNTRDLGVWKLTTLAGAYWRGNEKNPQLQRVYGLAFQTQDELDAHRKMLDEAERRDHKKLGIELDLFTFSELVGGGLPLWTPRGALIRNLLDQFVWELRSKRGYERVETPHITKKALYERSGHWDKYKDDLFKIKTREEHEFVMKPMNCPHHTQIYARRPWSYRDLPQRYANTTMVYRDEQSGELAGITRVLAITQDDAHVFCRMDQVEGESMKIWDMIQEFYRTFSIPLRVRLSLRDPHHPEKYLGDTAQWDHAERILRNLVAKREVQAEDGVGEAAFYGPKLDFMGRDAIGREHQVATIQLDMNMPERFDLACTAEDGTPERIVMIHAAIMGSIERFLAVAIEHYAGAFPTWLSPVQVAVVPVSAKHVKPAKKLGKILKDAGIRVEVNETNDTVGYKIRKAEKQKVPYMLVIGDKEKSLKKLSVRRRGEQKVKQTMVTKFLTQLQKEIVLRK